MSIISGDLALKLHAIQAEQEIGKENIQII